MKTSNNFLKGLYATSVYDKVTLCDEMFTENSVNMRTLFDLLEHMQYDRRGKKLKEIMERTRPNWTREFRELYLIYTLKGSLI